MKAEIVIIGGGSSGLYTAYFLAKSGVSDIVLLEKSYLGSGSTFRCATGIRASFTTEEHIVLQKESIRLWKEISEELGFFYLRGGYVWLFRTEDQLNSFKEFSKLHNSYGVPTKIITPEEIKELVPGINTEGVIGGLFDPLSAKADPFGTIFALASACRKMGVQIFPRVKVKRILTQNGKVKGVDSDLGEIEASKVLVAAGYGTRELLKTVNIDIPLENYPHHALITERYRDAFKPLVIDLATSTYVVQTKDGNFLMGTEMEESPNTPLTNRIDFFTCIVEPILRLFPWMKEIHVLRYWTGYYVMSPDRHPILGPIEDIEGLYVAAGYSGHGFMMGPVVGKVLSEWLTKGSVSIPQAERLTLNRIKEGRLIYEKAVIG